MKRSLFTALLVGAASSMALAQEKSPVTVINQGLTTGSSTYQGVESARRVNFNTQNHSARITGHIDSAQGYSSLRRYAFGLSERIEAAEKRFAARTGLRWKAQIRTLNASVQMENYFSGSDRTTKGYIWGYTAPDEPLVVMLNPASADGSVGRQIVIRKLQKGFKQVALHRAFVVESIARCGNDNARPIVGMEGEVSFAIPDDEVTVAVQRPDDFITEIVSHCPDTRSTAETKSTTTTTTETSEERKLAMRLPDAVRAGWNGEVHASGMGYVQHAGGSLTLFRWSGSSWQQTSTVCPPTGAPTNPKPPGVGALTPPTTPPNAVENPRPDPTVPNPGPQGGVNGPGNGGTPISKPPPPSSTPMADLLNGSDVLDTSLPKTRWT